MTGEVGEKPAMVKTHLRDVVVVPEMVGSIIGIYNGKGKCFIASNFNYSWSGFATYPFIRNIILKHYKSLQPNWSQARNDQPLHWWILHDLQASPSR